MAEHLRDLLPPVDPAQLDLAVRYEAEEQDQCRVFARQGACVFNGDEIFPTQLAAIRAI